MSQPHFKRLLPMMMIGLGTLALQAKTISPEEAISRISSGSNAPGLVRTHAPKATLVRCVTTQKGNSALYLYDMTGRPGYIVLSADDRLPAMLGYSETGNLSDPNLPDGLRWWLDMMTDEAQNVFELISEEEPESVYIPPSLGPAVDPLVKAVWGQTEPFNMFTPIIEESQSPTGCVATALTQIMNYHKWPLAPKGQISYKDSSTPANNYSMTFDGMTFDWDQITDEYDEESSEESKIAVSNLMKAVGYGVKMNYGKSSSGATDANACEAMKTFFGYSSDARMLRRESYTRDEWDKMLYSFISSGLPLYYTGRDAVWIGSGGHAFVCDGYDGAGFFHYNWGWNGKYNGFFLTSCLTPAGAGTGGFINGYNYTQSIMANLHPDNDKEYKLLDYVTGDKFELSISSMSVAATLSRGLGSDAFDVAISLTPAGSESPVFCPLGKGSNGNKKWTIPQDAFESLDKSVLYDLRLVWRRDSESEWSRIIPESTGLVVYTPGFMGGRLAWDNDNWKFTTDFVDQNPMNLMISDIAINDQDYYLTGKSNKFTFTLKNLGRDYEYHAARCYVVNDETGKEELFFNTSFQTTPLQSSNIKYTIKDTKTLTPGNYHFRFINVNYLQEIPCDKEYTMKVYDDNQIITFDDGTFVYSIIPEQPLVLTGTVTGEKVGGDVVIPTQVTNDGKTYTVEQIQPALTDLLDKNTLTSLRIDYPITSVGASELSSCKVLKELYLPETVREIARYGCAYNYELQKLVLPSRLDIVGDYAFYGLKALEELTVPVIENIPVRSFYNVNLLKSIIIPEGVKEIGESAFYYCNVCSSIEFPSTLESIGKRAFTTYDKTPIEVKVYRFVPPTMDPDAFSSTSYKVSKLLVPQGSKAFYAANPSWSKFSNIEEFVVTGIEAIEEAAEPDFVWFTLDGLRLTTKPSAAGIYLRLNRATAKTEKVIL